MRVTCICPTADRAKFIPQAIECFLKQTYTESDLLILDDGQEKVEHLVPDCDRIHYVRMPWKQTTGTKRNICCGMARGTIIAHWDDDDWSHPARLASQVELLFTSKKQLVGYHSIFYFDALTGKTFKYNGQESFIFGSTQVYFREWWQKNPFPDKRLGEDTIFTGQARKQGQALSMDCGRMMVARSHGANTSIKPLGEAMCPAVPLAEFPAEFLEMNQCQT